MQLDGAALLAADSGPQGELENGVNPTIAALARANGGRTLETSDGICFAKFPSAVEAVTCAVQVQRARFAASGSCRPLRVAVTHASDGSGGGQPKPDDINDVVSLMNVAEMGGISLGRTVYVVVRHDLKLPYDTQMEVKDWYHACVPFRLNSNKIDLVRDSVVRVSASAFANDPPAETSYESAPLWRAVRALFRRTGERQ